MSCTGGPKRAATSRDSSVDPSSSTRISSTGYVCASALSIASATCAALSNIGITTLTRRSASAPIVTTPLVVLAPLRQIALADACGPAALDRHLQHPGQRHLLEALRPGHVGVVEPVHEGDVVEDADAYAGFARPQEPVGVLVEAQRLVERADPVERPAPVDTAPDVHVHDRARLRVVPAQLRRHPAGLRQVAHPTQDDVDVGRRRERGHLALQLPVGPEVVGVEEREQFAPCCSESAVARRRRARVRLTERTHARAERLDQRGRVVGRAVVDHHDLQRFVALALHARDRLQQAAAGIEHRDHHAHHRRRGGHRRSSRRSPTAPAIPGRSSPTSSQ